MANIALNKLPLEKEKWKRVEILTNGNISTYDGSNGFASSFFPTTLTFSFDEGKQIECIRFLLWDGLGTPNAVKPNSRKYRFGLSISKDGVNYIQVFTNQNTEGSNGWFIFEFLNSTFARFVKLDCLSNDANKEFHIVEFEIHDQLPLDIQSSNQKKYLLNSGLPAYDDVKKLIEESIANKTDVLEKMNLRIDAFREEENRLKTALKEVGLLSESKSFLEEAEKNNKNAKKWLISASVVLFFFCIIICFFLWWDETSFKIIEKAKTKEISESLATILLSFYYFGKAVVISVLLFILGWFLKNYRSEKHNYTLNKHKFVSLSTANNIMINVEYKDIDKKTVFQEVLKNIFSHQSTGFSKDDQSASPNIINNLLSRSNIPE